MKDVYSSFETSAMSMAERTNMSLRDYYRIPVIEYYLTYESFINYKDAEKKAYDEAMNKR